ncbi:E3 ubiquitin-protein ligase, partial [Perkinsus olseni]
MEATPTTMVEITPSTVEAARHRGVSLAEQIMTELRDQTPENERSHRRTIVNSVKMLSMINNYFNNNEDVARTWSDGTLRSVAEEMVNSEPVGPRNYQGEPVYIDFVHNTYIDEFANACRFIVDRVLDGLDSSCLFVESGGMEKVAEAAISDKLPVCWGHMTYGHPILTLVKQVAHFNHQHHARHTQFYSEDPSSESELLSVRGYKLYKWPQAFVDASIRILRDEDMLQEKKWHKVGTLMSLLATALRDSSSSLHEDTVECFAELLRVMIVDTNFLTDLLYAVNSKLSPAERSERELQREKDRTAVKTAATNLQQRHMASLAAELSAHRSRLALPPGGPHAPDQFNYQFNVCLREMKDRLASPDYDISLDVALTCWLSARVLLSQISRVVNYPHRTLSRSRGQPRAASESQGTATRVTVSVQSRHCALLLAVMGRKMLQKALSTYPDLDDSITMDPSGSHHNMHLMADVVELLCKVHVEDRHHMIRSLCLDAFYKLHGADLLMEILLLALDMLQRLGDGPSGAEGEAAPFTSSLNVLSEAVQHVLWWFERTTSVKRLHNAAITTELSRAHQSLGPYVREDQKEKMKPLLDFNTVGLVSSLQYTFASSFVSKWRDDTVIECIPAKAAASLLKALTHVLEPDRSLLRSSSRPSSPEAPTGRGQGASDDGRAPMSTPHQPSARRPPVVLPPLSEVGSSESPPARSCGDPPENGMEESADEGSESNPVEEEDVRRADEFILDLEEFSGNGSDWKAYEDKEEVIACSKEVASDVMSRALVLGEKGRTQSMSAQTHIADVCVRLTGNKLIRLGPAVEGDGGGSNDLARLNCRHIARVCLDAVVADDASERLTRIAAHVLCCLTHANAAVVSNEITEMGPSFAQRLVELVASGGGSDEAQIDPRVTVVGGVKIAPFAKPLRKRDANGAVVGESSPSSVGEELANLPLSEGDKARMPPKWLSTVLVCVQKWLGCLVGLPNGRDTMLSLTKALVRVAERKPSMDPMQSQALLMCLAETTRYYECATEVLNSGGLWVLLTLPQISSYPGMLAHLKTVMLNICRDDDYIVEAEAKPIVLRYLATHNDYVRVSDGRPWAKTRDIVEAMAEKLAPTCIGRDVGSIIKKALRKYTKYCHFNDGWIALRDEVVEEAEALVRTDRRTNGDRPMSDTSSEPPKMAIPHNLAKTVSTILVALRVCMVGRGIGPAMTTSAAHYQANEEIACAASGEAKLANGAEQMLFLLSKLCQTLEVKHVLPELMFGPAIPERFLEGRQPWMDTDCFTWMAQNTGSCLLDFIGDGLYALSAVVGDHAAHSQASLWAGALAQEWLFVAVLNSGRTEGVVRQISDVLWKSLSDAFDGVGEKDVPKVDASIPQRQHPLKPSGEGDGTVPSEGAAEAARLMARAYLIYSMQLTKCRGQDGEEHFVLDGRPQLPGASDVAAYQTERVREAKVWLGDALSSLQLDQPYSPFVAESMLEPLVPLTRCPEFPESANVLPRGRSDVARADSVGDSSGQSSPRHEIMRDGGADVAADPQQEQPQEIHVEIVEEVDDGDEPDGGPGAGSDSQLDEEEADRSSVDDAMDVAPLTAAAAAAPREGDGLPTEDSSSGEDAAMAGIESSEQPSGDDEDEEDEQLFEAAEFMAEDNALDDMPDVDLDEIGDMDFEDALADMMGGDGVEDDSFFHIGGSDDDDEEEVDLLQPRHLRGGPRSMRGVMGGGRDVRWVSAGAPGGGQAGSGNSRRVFSIFDSAVREMSHNNNQRLRRNRRMSFDGIEPLWSFDVQAPGEHPLIARSHTGTSVGQQLQPPPAGGSSRTGHPGVLPPAQPDIDDTVQGVADAVEHMTSEEVAPPAVTTTTTATEEPREEEEASTEEAIMDEADEVDGGDEEVAEQAASPEEGAVVGGDTAVPMETEEAAAEAEPSDDQQQQQQAEGAEEAGEVDLPPAVEIPALTAAAARLNVAPSALLDATGIDASVLEALPQDMHEDIIREHVAQIDNATLRRLQQQNSSVAGRTSRAPEGEQEQQQQQEEAGEPALEEGMDNATFLATLTDPQLREEILMTAAPQFLETLPAEVRAEARALRDRAGAMRFAGLGAAAGRGGGARRGGGVAPPQSGARAAPDPNRIRIRLGSGWQGADIGGTAAGPGAEPGQMLTLPAGDVADLLDLTSHFAANRGGPASAAGGGTGHSRALVNLLFDVLQRSEATGGGRHWVDGSRLMDASLPPGRGSELAASSRGTLSWGGVQMGASREHGAAREEHTAISDRKCHLCDQFEVPSPMPLEFVDALLRLLWMRYLLPGLKAKLDEITHHLCLHRALRLRLYTAAMRMLLELLRGADSVRINENRPEMEMPCTRLLGEPDTPPFAKLEVPSGDDPAKVRATMASRLLVAVEFILTWVPSSREWLIHPVHSASSSAGKAPTGIEVLMDIISSPLLDASAVTFGNLILLLSKLVVPHRPKPVAAAPEESSRSPDAAPRSSTGEVQSAEQLAAKQRRRAEKSLQRSRVLMQHISADAAKRLMEYVFGPASGDLLQRRTHAGRLDPRYEISGDISLVNPFAMERVLHKGIALVVALAESDSHGRQLRAALAEELGRLAEGIVGLLKEPTDSEEANERLLRAGQRLMRFVGAYKQVARNKCRDLPEDEFDTAYRNTLAEYLSGTTSNPGLMDLWEALDESLLPYDEIDIRQTEGQRQLEELRARERADDTAVAPSSSTSSVVEGDEER